MLFDEMTDQSASFSGIFRGMMTCTLHEQPYYVTLIYDDEANGAI